MTSALRTPRRRPSADGPRANGAGLDERPAGRFRPSPRRRNRIAAGVALGATAIAGNVYVYSSLNEASPVVQVVRDVPAGEQLRADALRPVDAMLDDTVQAVPGDDLEQLVGQYARVRLVAGSLVTSASVQPGPLVDPGNAVVAVRVPEGALPVGLRERVPIELVLPPDDDGEATVVPGVVVALPSRPDSVLGTLSLSVELAAADAPVVAASDDVRVVLLAPAVEQGG